MANPPAPLFSFVYSLPDPTTVELGVPLYETEGRPLPRGLSLSLNEVTPVERPLEGALPIGRCRVKRIVIDQYLNLHLTPPTRDAASEARRTHSISRPKTRVRRARVMPLVRALLSGTPRANVEEAVLCRGVAAAVHVGF